MATVKIKLRLSSASTKEGTLYYQVIHNRVARQITTKCKIYLTEWDSFRTQIVIPPDTDANRCHYLVSLKKRIKEDLSHLTSIFARLDRSCEHYTTDRIIELYYSDTDNGGFLSFGLSTVNQLRQIGKTRTSETYTVALNSFTRFLDDRGDVSLDKVDSGLMSEYEFYLQSKGVCPNSSSFYMRNLRAIYNRAVDKELVIQKYPFKYVYTGIDKTVKRAVPIQVIRQIRDLDLTLSPSMDYARDLFMFSFYTRGMSFVDMAYLKKKDLQNGILSYRRHKTNQQLFIKWEKPMQDIIDKYDAQNSPYLLPIIRNISEDARKQYKNAEHRVNAKLKKIGVQLGLGVPLTTYVARHGWASIAKSKNIPISTISEAMGHDSENTTRIYLASLDTSLVDKANSLILKLL